MPAQSVDDAGPLGDKVVAVAGQRPNLAGWAVELGGRQVGLAQGGSGHGEGVDRVGLAVASVGHERCVPGAEQVAFESPRQVAAVLPAAVPDDRVHLALIE